MIYLHKSGTYKLIETKNAVKILYLDNRAYAWIKAKGIGEMLVISHIFHKSDCLLATGHYRLYGVEDEPNLKDLPHLELEVASDIWQGYLLLTGLPDNRRKRVRIIPTNELIANTAMISNVPPTPEKQQSTIH